MKYARLGLLALVAALAGIALLGTESASGQVSADRKTTAYPVITAQNPYWVQNGPDANHLYWAQTPITANSEFQKWLGEEANLEREASGLIEQYSRTDDEAQRGKTRTKLSEILQKQFDLQQKRRDLEVAQIESQLKKLREVMRKRGEARQTIVEKRLDQLLREAEGLGWTPPHGGSGPRNLLFAPNQPLAK